MTVIDTAGFFYSPTRLDHRSESAALPAETIAFGEPAACLKLWHMMLLMAIRDHATEVSYLPGGAPTLTYTTGGIRYEFVPPPDTSSAELVNTARRLVMPGRLAEWRWRLAGLWGDRSAAALVALNSAGGQSHWAVTVWQAEGWQGVHFRRLDAVPHPLPADEPAAAVESETS